MNFSEEFSSLDAGLDSIRDGQSGPGSGEST